MIELDIILPFHWHGVVGWRCEYLQKSFNDMATCLTNVRRQILKRLAYDRLKEKRKHVNDQIQSINAPFYFECHEKLSSKRIRISFGIKGYPPWSQVGSRTEKIVSSL